MEIGESWNERPANPSTLAVTECLKVAAASPIGEASLRHAGG